MAPVWLAVIAVEYVGHRFYFAPRPGPHARDDRLPAARAAARRTAGVVAVMLVGFAALSPLGVRAGVGRRGGRGRAERLRAVPPAHRRRARWSAAAHLSFAVFVLCLGVVVAGLTDTFLGDLVRAAVPGDDGLVALVVIALVATALANVVNNLPATLLLVPLVAPLGVTAVLAALIGLGVGSGLTYTGSLANLLWRRTLIRHGGQAVGAGLPPAVRAGDAAGRARRRGRAVGLGAAGQLEPSAAAPAAAPCRRSRGTRAWLSSPICTSATSVNPASTNAPTASTIASTSGPHGIDVGDVLGPHELGRAGEARRARAARR